MLVKLACNMGKKEDIELAEQFDDKRSTCPCKRTKCVHHGNCKKCIAHHKENKTKYEPYCMRKSRRKVRNK